MMKTMSVNNSLCKISLPTNALEADSVENSTASSNRCAQAATIDGRALAETGMDPLGPAVLAAIT